MCWLWRVWRGRSLTRWKTVLRNRVYLNRLDLTWPELTNHFLTWQERTQLTWFYWTCLNNSWLYLTLLLEKIWPYLHWLVIDLLILKAFDCISFEFIENSLKIFNPNQTTINWILHSSTLFRVLNHIVIRFLLLLLAHFWFIVLISLYSCKFPKFFTLLSYPHFYLTFNLQF